MNATIENAHKTLVIRMKNHYNMTDEEQMTHLQRIADARIYMERGTSAADYCQLLRERGLDSKTMLGYMADWSWLSMELKMLRDTEKREAYNAKRRAAYAAKKAAKAT